MLYIYTYKAILYLDMPSQIYNIMFCYMTGDNLVS